VPGGPGVVVHFLLNSSGASEVWKLGEEGVDRCTATDDFDAGDKKAGGLDRCRQRRDAVKQAVASTVLQSPKSIKSVRKWAPMRGCVTSVTTAIQSPRFHRPVHHRHTPRLWTGQR
jgi:hypothetical protein